jgi:hypothetical protein
MNSETINRLVLRRLVIESFLLLSQTENKPIDQLFDEIKHELDEDDIAQWAPKND